MAQLSKEMYLVTVRNVESIKREKMGGVKIKEDGTRERNESIQARSEAKHMCDLKCRGNIETQDRKYLSPKIETALQKLKLNNKSQVACQSICVRLTRSIHNFIQMGGNSSDNRVRSRRKMNIGCELNVVQWLWCAVICFLDCLLKALLRMPL